MCVQNATARGVGGHVPPENFWNLEAMDVYPFCPLHRTALTWFSLSNRLLISQATSFTDKVCETNHLLGRTGSYCKKTWKSFSHCLQPFRKLQHVTFVLWGPCGRPPSNGANWRYQASHE